MNKQYCVYIMTKKYHVWKLVYYEAYEDPKTAIKREKQIKNLVRRKKEDLIKSINPEFEEIKLDDVIIL